MSNRVDAQYIYAIKTKQNSPNLALNVHKAVCNKMRKRGLRGLPLKV